MLAALFLTSLAVASAACCSKGLQYTVSSPNGGSTLTYTFASNYAGDTLSNGNNASIAVVRGCSVDFVLDGSSLTNHPFDIQFAANSSQISGFTQGQKSGTQTWTVPDVASTTTYKYQCEFHTVMHNYIRVLDNCDMDLALKDCDTYCANITALCTGANIQFPNPDTHNQCMSSCEFYPDNATLSTSGDSYQCRMYQVSRAKQNPGMYCDAAGFNGGAYSSTKCGTFCDAYCDAILGGCNDTAVFPDRDTCMRECSYYPTNSSFDLSSPALAYNNTIDCRTWHVQIAINSSDPGTKMLHCGHASPQGGNICGTGCENYCDNDLKACTGSLMQWNDRAQCLKACSTWPGQTNVTFVANTVTSGNSLPCRKYHAGVAGVSPDNANTHCIHSGPLGGNYCGNECEGLCNLAVVACPSLVNSTNCATLCNNLTSSDTVATQKILSASVPLGSVGCATYWTLKALSDNSLCSKVSNVFMPAPGGGKCDSSSAVLLKVSWAFIALIFLALVGTN